MYEDVGASAVDFLDAGQIEDEFPLVLIQEIVYHRLDDAVSTRVVILPLRCTTTMSGSTSVVSICRLTTALLPGLRRI